MSTSPRSLQARLADARDKRAKGEGGFTLIELLVVVVIIGILVAIAIPLYLNYRKGAAEKSVQSDVRAAVSTVEQCIGENNNTLPTTASTTGNDTKGGPVVLTCSATGVTPPITETANVGASNYLKYETITGGYQLTGHNDDVQFVYKSTDGTTTKSAYTKAA